MCVFQVLYFQTNDHYLFDMKDGHNIESFPVATPPDIEDGLSSGSPSARTPVVEVIMPIPRISPTTKRTRVSTDSARVDRAKRARFMVGSPSLRIISQIQVSTPTTTSPRITTEAHNPRGKITLSIVGNNIICLCNLPRDVKL